MLNLHGKRAVVCGSTQGLGRASAEEMARLGATITLVARNEGALQKVQSSLSTSMGQEHGYIVADFDDVHEVEKAIQAHALKAPPTHILVNNTGGPPGGKASDATLEAFSQAFSNHLLCNQVLVQALVPGMKAEGYGRIINIISTSVKQPIPNLGVSNTIRGAVANWAKTLANELGSWGITVNNVLPGSTETARLTSIIANKAAAQNRSTEEVATMMRNAIPAGRFGQPEEIGYAVAFLASPWANYINGINLPVDGGRTKSL